MPNAGEWSRALTSGAANLGIAITDQALIVYRAHFDLLTTHAPRVGLTSLTDPVAIAIKHYLDSLTCLLVRDICAGEEVIDIGSGGGFPGMVLAISRPKARVTLVDSSTKCTAFLRLATTTLGLSNVAAITARAEDLGHWQDRRERHDLILSRALAPLPVLLEYGLPLARIGGHLLAMKGPEADAELAESTTALEILGGRLIRRHSLELPEQMGGRALLLIDKISPTPARYPRRPGIPARKPLIRR